MGSRGTNNSLQTAPLYPTASAGDEASSQNTTASAGEIVLVPSPCQASPAVIQSAGLTTGGLLPELVALISQTVQAALTAERASSSAAPSTVLLPSASAVIPASATCTLPCSVGIPASIPSLTSSAESLMASGRGFNVQAVQGRPNYSLVMPSFVSTFALPSMSRSVPSTIATNVDSSQSGAIRDVAFRPVGQPAPLLDQPFVVVLVFCPCRRRPSLRLLQASTWI